ncbi:hypothetical protein EIN_486820 [Entamoeba invadens IP1]|uniref:SAM domain-containing protein n=1 Tax=Entamoeba invadens IP1 TaxID=370355 RepID=A0A0A1U857_ENTIV|nr:hypothetical protein EIN_486820 [Entamoeba invadens IP1]ELP89220.1 hypothetical protein EIN_486820 [Entamoeba invadens IP1]|eukprot:XP_004255991.1 hypothetical protein EIN_486820 [Entamoeba invadens IP1]
MGFCVIEHSLQGDPSTKLEQLYSIYSEFNSLLDKYPQYTKETCFLHLPKYRIIPGWSETLTNYVNDGDTLRVDLFPIAPEVVQKFHSQYSTTELPENLNHIVGELKLKKKENEKKVLPSISITTNMTSPRGKVHHFSDIVLGRQFNISIARVPSCSYTSKLPHLITIKTPVLKKDIPALWFRSSIKTSVSKIEDVQPFTLLYFHDCNEDLGMISSSLEVLSQTLQCNILAIEYPSYGIYEYEYSDELMETNLKLAYSYLVGILNKRPERILVLGKGVGAAVALLVSSKKDKKVKKVPCAGVILVSPKMDPASFGKGIFENTKTLKKVKVPTFIVYGEKYRFAQAMKKLQVLLPAVQSVVGLPEVGEDLEGIAFDEYMEILMKFVSAVFPEFIGVMTGRALEQLKPMKYIENPLDVINKTLERFGLEKYRDQFICFGFMGVQDLILMTDEDISMMGINEEDALKVNKMIESLKVEISEKRGRHGSEGFGPVVNSTPEILPCKTPRF